MVFIKKGAGREGPRPAMCDESECDDFGHLRRVGDVAEESLRDRSFPVSTRLVLEPTKLIDDGAVAPAQLGGVVRVLLDVGGRKDCVPLVPGSPTQAGRVDRLVQDRSRTLIAHSPLHFLVSSLVGFIPRIHYEGVSGELCG